MKFHNAQKLVNPFTAGTYEVSGGLLANVSVTITPNNCTVVDSHAFRESTLN